MPSITVLQPTLEEYAGARSHSVRPRHLSVSKTRVGQGCIGKGRGTPTPPSRALSLRPATVPLTASAGFNGLCNRQ